VIVHEQDGGPPRGRGDGLKRHGAPAWAERWVPTPGRLRSRCAAR
jgi:hypothetical protein